MSPRRLIAGWAVIWNIAFVTAFNAGLAGLPPWAALAVCVLISVKTQFSEECLKFSKNCLNVLMEQQFQDFFSLFCSAFSPFFICISCFSCNTCLVFYWCRIYYGICIITISRKLIRLISVIIPQTSCCFSIVLLYSRKLYIGITTSKSSALWINTLLIFDMQLVNGASFLNPKNLFLHQQNLYLQPLWE